MTFSLADVLSKDRMEAESPGNAGMVVVDTSDFTWKAYGGYLADNERRQLMTSSNSERAARFQAALAASGDDDPADRLVDMLTDARHWCDLNGQSFWELDRRAHQHYLTELT